MKVEKILYVLLNSRTIPHWHLKLIESIDDKTKFKLKLIIVKNYSSNKKKSYFLNLFKNIDNKVFKKKLDLSKPISINNISNFIDTIKIDYKNIKNDFYKITDKKNNFLLINLSNLDLESEITSIFKYGVWRFKIGSIINGIENSNGIYEVINQINSTNSLLIVNVKGLKKEKIVYKAISSTDPNSITRGINKIYLNAINYPIILLNKLEMGHKLEEFFISDFNEDNISIFLTNFQIKYKILNHYMYYTINKIINHFYKKQWFILYQKNTDHFLEKVPHFKKILPPKDRFYADPFPVKYKDEYFLFIEEILFNENKGFISVIKIDNQGNVQKPIKVLEEDYHLSYPFIINDSNKRYMIPETTSNKKISIYECKKFPYEWKFKMHLLDDIIGADTTIFKKNNKYYMFTSVYNNDENILYDELHLYFSDKLLSKNWNPHPMNPIISDARKARPAGNIFYYKEKIIRPAQNCLKNYGAGIVYNEIKILNDKEYNEVEIKSVNPYWDSSLYGVHTCNTINNFTVIDALRKIRK